MGANCVHRNKNGEVIPFHVFERPSMEQSSSTLHLSTASGASAAVESKKLSDYIYQIATLAAVLLLLLTTTI